MSILWGITIFLFCS